MSKIGHVGLCGWAWFVIVAQGGRDGNDQDNEPIYHVNGIYTTPKRSLACFGLSIHFGYNLPSNANKVTFLVVCKSMIMFSYPHCTRAIGCFWWRCAIVQLVWMQKVTNLVVFCDPLNNLATLSLKALYTTPRGLLEVLDCWSTLGATRNSTQHYGRHSTMCVRAGFYIHTHIAC